MVKRASTLLIIDLLLILMSIACSSSARRVAERQERKLDQNVPALTLAEENDLRRLLPIALSEVKTWHLPINCLRDDKIVPLDFAALISRYEGHSVNMRLDIRAESVVAYLDELHFYAVFPRLYDVGLGPAESEVFCEDSFGDHVSAQQRYPYVKELLQKKSLVRGDPVLSAIIEDIQRERGERVEAVREEQRKYEVPYLTTERMSPSAMWDEEKRRLYKRIVDLARASECYDGSGVLRLTVPDFEVGVGEVRVLVRGSGWKEIVIIKMGREAGSGDWKPVRIEKRIQLGDKADPWEKLINRLAVRREQIVCQEAGRTVDEQESL